MYTDIIDPNVIRKVKQNTVKQLVHTGKKTSVTKRKREDEDKPIFLSKKIKQKVEQYNQHFTKENIDIYLQIEDNKESFSIKVFNKTEGKLIRKYEENEVTDMLIKLDDLIGIIVDKTV